MLAITGSGIFLAILVALGGWENRDLGKGAKILFGVISAILIIFGSIGIVAIIYPAISNNISSMQKDFSTTPSVSPALLYTGILILLIVGGLIVRGQFKKRLQTKKNVLLPKPTVEFKWASVVYENRNMWGDHMATYAAIRIDNRSNCRDLVARLFRVTQNNIELNIDMINPTGNDLRWSQEGNRCILQVVAERDETAVFVFMNKRESRPLEPGEYTIEIVLSDMADSKARQTKIVKKLMVKKPHHYLQTHETGIEWQ